MSPSDLYHQHGVREKIYTHAEYSSISIVLHIKTKKDKYYCTHCKSKNDIKSGVVVRDIHTVPVGGMPMVQRMMVQRLECKDCGHVCQEHIHFAAQQATFTRHLVKYIVVYCIT
ncbi:MAG: transposase family protein [Bacteroidales bacterium]|nr:transposase family protein [Bacteroidales bacterium]